MGGSVSPFAHSGVSVVVARAESSPTPGNTAAHAPDPEATSHAPGPATVHAAGAHTVVSV